MVDLLACPERTVIHNDRPRFSWIVNSSENNSYQHAFQILVATEAACLARDEGDVWDSGVPSPGGEWRTEPHSTSVLDDGKPLAPNTRFYWKVRVWFGATEMSPWSEAQQFATAEIFDQPETPHYDPVATVVAPSRFINLSENHSFVDFGRAAFGTIELTIDSPIAASLEIHLGEVCRGHYKIDRTPGGARRYRAVELWLEKGKRTYRVVIPPDERNTIDFAIKMPQSLFEVFPFRYCEIVGSPVALDRTCIRQLAVHYPFDDTAALFRSSNRVLNDVWDFCHYTMKATSFCGFYVDGDRERIPYEADAYINQLGHYGCDREYTLARRTLEYLIATPTWPTEWHLYLVLAAWNDYLYTGDPTFIVEWYEDFRGKSLIGLARDDGLLVTDHVPGEILEEIHFSGKSADFFTEGVRDVVDWPQIERDGHEMCPVNSVVNALHYRALITLAKMARAVGKDQEAIQLETRFERVRDSFLEVLIDAETQLVVDGEGSNHSSLHSNLFAVACGLINEISLPRILEYIKSRGMACSVYASQMLLEALYAAGEGSYALSLLAGIGERSWAHMIYDVGSTIALEAWDDRLKPNQDWNHAWGAAPAGMIPFGLMGISPLEPGFAKVLINPQIGDLAWAEIKTPTIKGPIHVICTNEPGRRFMIECEIPGNVTARIGLPVVTSGSASVIVDGKPVFGDMRGDRVFVDGLGSGRHTIVS